MIAVNITVVVITMLDSGLRRNDGRGAGMPVGGVGMTVKVLE